MQHEIQPRVDPLLAKLTHKVMEKNTRRRGKQREGGREEWGVGIVSGERERERECEKERERERSRGAICEQKINNSTLRCVRTTLNV